MSALEKLGQLVAHTKAPEGAARELIELHVIDTVGAWIAGAATREGAALLRYRAAIPQRVEDARERADGGAPHRVEDARQRATGGALLRMMAAEALALDLATRCALARLSEIDDIHLASMTTPGAIVIPAALTLAAPEAAPDDMLAAISAGYEVMIRLGRAIDGPTVLYRGIWPTYFTAPLGVAAVAARLHGLDVRQTAHALALALTFAAPGVGHHNAPTTSRWIAVGNAARSGLMAAQAAQHGFTSDIGLIDSGFLAGVYGIEADVAALTNESVANSALSEISFKPWCAARQTMAATQALREIIEGGVAADDITAIEVAVLPPHRKMIDHGVIAADRASHLTSLSYCMAVAALAPDLAFDVQQTPDAVAPKIRAFMDRISIAAADSLLADYPRIWPARITVQARSTRHERNVTHVPGDPARPFDRAGVHEKFRRFVPPVAGAAATDDLLQVCSEAVATARFAPLVDKVEATCARLLDEA